MDETEKKKKARAILLHLKEEVLQIILETEAQQYCNHQQILPWLEEDAEYAIKRLDLSPQKEKYYLKKVYRIFGEYSEELPYLKRRDNSVRNQA